MNTKHKFLAVVSSVALIGGVLAPAASAATASRPGSYSWSSGTSATNRDTAADGKFTSVKWGHSNNATGTFVTRTGTTRRRVARRVPPS